MTTPSGAERIAAIRSRFKSATPPPWRLNSDGDIVQTTHATRDVWYIPQTDADMVFIANAPSDVEFLLAEIARLQRLETPHE